MTRAEYWPELPSDGWKDTCATLHLWNQIVGKVRLDLKPSGWKSGSGQCLSSSPTL